MLVSSHHTGRVVYSYRSITADISQLCKSQNFYLLREVIYIMAVHFIFSNYKTAFQTFVVQVVGIFELEVLLL